MVKRGFTRILGSSLQQWVSKGTTNRFTSFFAGFFVTGLLQSSTAATLLMLSFVKKHGIALSAALAFVIGADVATTIVAQILTFDLSWLSPALLAAGVILHMRNERGGKKRHIALVLIGVGFMLLSLSLIRDVTIPLKTSETLPLIMGPLDNDPYMAIFFALIFTWAVHSSLAAILLFATFAGNDMISMQLGLLLVVGTNLGGAMISFATTFSQGAQERQITFGNIIMRGICAVIFFIGAHHILALTNMLDLDPARQIVTLHVAFNIALAVLFLPFVGIISKISPLIFPDSNKTEYREDDPIYLDDQSLITPVVALSLAARETLRMAEMVEDMLEQTIECFKENTDIMAEHISARDDAIDNLYSAIKVYMAKLTQESLDPQETDRYMQILTFATNLEHIGDIIDKSLMALAQKKIRRNERFSDAGWQEITNFHAQVLTNMKLSQNIFLSEDPTLARTLIDRKKTMRDAEKESTAKHFKRLSEGQRETIATSTLHLDIIRDYRRINSYITAVAYSILGLE